MKLGDFIDFCNGRTSPERLAGASVPVMGSNGCIGFAEDSNVEQPCTVIGRVGSYCGSTHFVEQPCWVTDNAISAVSKDPRAARFWHGFLANFGLNMLAHGSGQPLLTQSVLKNIDVPNFTNEERYAIADVLGALDDKIAANQRVISDAAELCEALVQKSISGEFTKLSEIAVITMGTSPKGEDLNEEGRGIPFFQGVRDFGDISPKRRVCTDKPLRTAEPGDVLLAVRAPVGQVNLALEKVCIGRGLAAVRSAINSPVSLFYLLRSHREIWQDFDGNGTVFSSVNRSDAHNVLVPIILPTKQKDLEKVLNTIHGRLLKAQKENQVLAATRDELLPLLMNGKITVAEVKEAAGDVGVVKQKQQEDGDSDV